MTVRSHGRQYALQMLYQNHYTYQEPETMRQHFWRNLEDVDSGTRSFTMELVKGVLEHREAIDLEIAAYLKGWTLERINLIDRFIMEIAILELMIRKQIPWRVAIDEAVQLASYFSSDNSPKFVNGVLHAWCSANDLVGKKDRKESEPPPANDATIDWRDDEEVGEPTE